MIWATTLVVNLRHVLYSATLAPYVAHLPMRWRLALSGLLTDEVFAVAYAHYQKRAPGEIGPHYFFGSGVAMYLNWQAWTLIGLLFGAAFPGLKSLGLDFAMVATVIAIIVPMTVSPHGEGAEITWRNPQLVAALVAIVVCTFRSGRC